MTYRQIFTSIAIVGLQLVLIVALVWITQP